MRAVRLLTLAAAGAAAAYTLPAITALAPVRTGLFPTLSGTGDPGRVALTFDDGPDPVSTPRFLRLLEKRGVTATFFLLGTMAQRAPGLARELAAAGHEVALHGHTHRCLALRGPKSTLDDIARGQAAVAELTGTNPRWYRPPYGVLTAGALAATRQLGLQPVLWSAWGRDWERAATGASVVRTVRKGLRPGATVLLHDSDCTSAPGSWRATLSAVPELLDHCEQHGWSIGPLREHGLPGRTAL
jgi:peptidoglycan-N-acetylglucosamine deacetylase